LADLVVLFATGDHESIILKVLKSCGLHAPSAAATLGVVMSSSAICLRCEVIVVE